MTLAGRSALVTGASAGIGLAIAQRLAQAGARLAITARGEAALAEAERGLGEAGAEVLAQAADVADPEAVARLVDAVRTRFGGIDILVCNAGVNPHRGRSVLATELTDWDAIMAVNLRGVFLCLKQVVPLMQRSGRGRIITIGSIGGRIVPDGANCAYRASKFGLRGLTWSFAKALRDHDIAVSSILPGSTRTAMTGDGETEGYLDPRDVAEVAAFVAQLDPRIVVPEITVSPRVDIGGPLCPYN